MDPLSITASVAGIVSLGLQITKSLIDFYSAYKDQKREVADTVKSLEFLLRRLDTTRNRVDKRNATTKQGDVLDEINNLLQDCNKCVADLHDEYKKFQGNRKLSYPHHRKRLQRREDDVHDVLSQLKLALSQLLQDDVEELLHLVRADHTSRNIRDWLNAPDATVNFNEIHKKRHRNTGLWFVEGLEFTTWLTQPNSFLWLHGFAGCGKSVLSSTAIQSTFQHRQSNPRPRTSLAFFFFTFNDNAKQDASGMLRALILQLSGQLDDDHHILAQLHESHGKSSPSTAILRDCLRQLVERYDATYVVLDALDESPLDMDRRKDVLDEVVEMRKWATVHLLVTSRDEPDIRDVFRHTIDPTPDEMVCLKNSHIDADITSFVSASLNEDARLRRFNGKYHDQIQQALTKGAKGVFRWVECQLLSLRYCPTSTKHVEILLASLPKSLDGTYERILVEIGKRGFADEARRLLTILAYARRPLHVEEVFEALAVDIQDNPRFDPDARLEDEEDIHRICPGLIEVHHPTSNDEQPTVHIAHFSVQEYLESDRIRQSKAEAFAITREQAHGEIATICLAYLQDLDKTRSFGVPPFGLYSKELWVVHAHLASPKPALASTVISSSSHIATDPLLLDCFAVHHRDTGYEASLQWLLASGIEIEVQDAVGRSPLHLAVHNNYTECCRILLQRGATITTERSDMTPFHYAIATESEDIAQVFLDADQPIDIRVQSLTGRESSLDFEGLTALHASALCGSEDMTKFLLDHGADPNAVSELGETPLHLTLARDVYRAHDRRGISWWSQGYDRIEFMLEGIKEDQGIYNKVAAYVRDGRSAVLKLLLDHPLIDIHATDACGRAPIHAAIFGGSLDAVTTLIQRGADILNVDGDGLNRLHYAAGQANINIVQFFLDSIPDQEELRAFGKSKDGQGRNALHHALISDRQNRFEMTEYLLAHTSIRVNDEDNTGMPPLATYLRLTRTDRATADRKIVHLLLESGSNPSFTTRDEGLGLAHLYASTIGIIDIEILRIMSKNHVDLKMTDSQGRTVLHHAAIRHSITEEALHFLCSDEVGLSTEIRDT